MLLCVGGDVFFEVFFGLLGGLLLCLEVFEFCLVGGGFFVSVCVVCLVGDLLYLGVVFSGVGSYGGDYGVELVDAEHFEDKWSAVAGVHGGEGVEFFLFGEYGGVE